VTESTSPESRFTQVAVKGENGAIGNLWQRSDGQEPFSEILEEHGQFHLYIKRRVRVVHAGVYRTLLEAQAAAP
jgi:hypothetical protein